MKQDKHHTAAAQRKESFFAVKYVPNKTNSLNKKCLKEFLESKFIEPAL